MPRLLVVLLLALLPFPLVYWLSAQDRHYDELLTGIRDAQECVSEPCKVDFDGDAIPGLLYIDRASPAEYYDSWLVAVDKGHEILRLPYRRLDNTLRTHVGIRTDNGRIHLLVYDHMNRPGPSISTVFAWNGSGLVEINASRDEQELLKAMSARDDAGTFTYWAAYRTLRLPALTLYYVISGGVYAWWIVRRKRRKRFSLK